MNKLFNFIQSFFTNFQKFKKEIIISLINSFFYFNKFSNL